MLLYESGAMFKQHRDSEKVPGMFGTLVICLPSEHTGGAVRLCHDGKVMKFDTSDTSAFEATYLAWYADVVHEIETVQSGYRWILTYNLIRTVKRDAPSASTLDVRTNAFTRILSQWTNMKTTPQYLVWPLSHKYTNAKLRLANLNAEDYIRVLHAANGSKEHDRFYILLANVSKCAVHPNNENQDDNECTEQIRLEHIVDVDGFKLSLPGKALIIPKLRFIYQIYHDGRIPDQQTGGEYLGNQYSEIKRVYKNSAMILVEKDDVARFLMGNNYKLDRVRDLIDILSQRMDKKTTDNTSKEFLLQICRHILSSKYESDNIKDCYIGYAAVASAYSQNAALFSQCVQRTTSQYDIQVYKSLGHVSASTDDNVIDANDVEDVLTRCGKLYEICGNLHSYWSGFITAKPYRRNSLGKQHVLRWIDSILFQSLSDVENAYAEDAVQLLGRIDIYENDNIGEFVIFTGIKRFVRRFLHHAPFITALAVELMSNVDDEDLVDSHRRLFEDLIRIILEPFISIFELGEYAAYVNTTFYEKPGPIRTLFGYLAQGRENIRRDLLTKIQAQASTLTEAQFDSFMPYLLRDLVAVIDLSLVSSQKFFQSLITTYLMCTVGKEPEKPTDWTRLEDMSRHPGGCYREECNDCATIANYLRHPETQTLTMMTSQQGHITGIFKGLKHLDATWAPTLSEKRRLTLTKTFKWYKKQHKSWVSRGTRELKFLHSFLGRKLKQCLAEQYTEIMELRMLKVNEQLPGAGVDGHESGEGQEQDMEEVCNNGSGKRRRINEA